MEQNKSAVVSPQFVLGIMIILVGVLILADNFDLVNAREYLRYWPAILVVWGAAKVVQSPGSPGRVFGGILIFIGGMMLLDKMYILEFHLFDWWPLILIIVGINFLRGTWTRSRSRNSFQPGAADIASESFVKHFALMSGVKRIITTKEFRGGELTAIMGGIEIDFVDAQMKGEEAVLDVFTVWGGIEIRVPATWTVVVQAVPIMGGVEDRTYPAKETGTTRRLIITGNIVMGGVEVKN